MIFITCTLLSISVLAAILSPFFLCEASIETKNLFSSKEKDLPEEETLLDQYLFLEKSFKNGKISKTSFERQKEFLKEFGKNEWSAFEYDNKKDFVKFFSDQIKRVGRTLTKDKKGKIMVVEPVGRYEVWNPSDVWAAYKLPKIQD